MDKTDTKILFSFDKFVNSEEVIQAAVAVARKSMASLEYIMTDESGALGSGGGDVIGDFKLKHGVQLEISTYPGTFWKALAKAAEKLAATIVVAGSQPAKAGLLGGGMTSKVDAFTCSILYLNEKAKWQIPNDILMPLDTSSETRQKFFHVSHWAKLFYANVEVIGLKKSDKGEDAKMSHIYTIQGHNYMVEKGIRTSTTEMEPTLDIVASLLKHSETFRSKWMSVLSNAEGAFRISAFQKVCEEATFPLLIVPYHEPIGMGGSGY